MNLTEQRESFAALVRHHEPLHSPKLRILMELRDSIAEARNKGASHEVIRTYLHQTGIDVSTTVIIPVCHEADSVAQVKLLSDVLGNHVDYVVVKNEGLSQHFQLYEQSQVRKRLTGELKGREMVMPELYEWLVAKLNAENLTVTQAIASDKLSLMDRQRLKSWQRRFNEQLETVKDVLLALNGKLFLG